MIADGISASWRVFLQYGNGMGLVWQVIPTALCTFLRIFRRRGGIIGAAEEVLRDYGLGRSVSLATSDRAFGDLALEMFA
jgi:hypothetical protein